MELALTRDVFGGEWTLGVLTVDGKSFGFVVEDQDRGLAATDALLAIEAIKVPFETAIPVGRYRVKTTWSNRFQRMMPLVMDVPGFRGIRIHRGTTEKHTAGCLCPGLRRDVVAGTVSKSEAASDWLYTAIAQVEADGSEVWITVQRASAVA
ncbi:MAG: DUF5675 family protein [Pseudomonadota bacterium]|nr:DUF5675 family protein [Pseudomonadota bacterium]